MGLDKAINHGKEKRKAYIGAKAVAKCCRNHGSCDYCRQNREHGSRVRETAVKEQLRNYKYKEDFDD